MKKFKYLIIFASLFLLTGCFEEEEKKDILVIKTPDITTNTESLNLRDLSNSKDSADRIITSVKSEADSDIKSINYITELDDNNGKQHTYRYKTAGSDDVSIDVTFNVEKNSIYSISLEVNKEASYNYFNTLRNALLKATDLYDNCSDNEKCKLVLQDIDIMQETTSYISTIDDYLISLSVYNYQQYGENNSNKYSFVIVNKK